MLCPQIEARDAVFKETPDASPKPQGGGEDEWRRLRRFGILLVVLQAASSAMDEQSKN